MYIYDKKILKEAMSELYAKEFKIPVKTAFRNLVKLKVEKLDKFPNQAVFLENNEFYVFAIHESNLKKF